MRAEGIFDVDANTAIDQLAEDLNIKMPEVRYLYYSLLLIYILMNKFLILFESFC